MKLFFNVDVHPFYSEIRFSVTNGVTNEIITEKYTSAEDDWGSIMFDGKQYDWNISHICGMPSQDLISIYEVDLENNYNVDLSKPLKNKWVRIFI